MSKEKKPKLLSKEFSPEVFKQNLAQVKENLKGIRQAFGEVFFPRLAKKPRLLRRFRQEEPEEPEKVVIIERETPKSKSRHEALRKGYVKESYQPYTDYTRTQPKTREEVEEPEEEVEHRPQKKEFQGVVGAIGFLRTLFEQSSEQVKLRTEYEKLKLEKLKKKLEEQEKAGRKVEGHSGRHY